MKFLRALADTDTEESDIRTLANPIIATTDALMASHCPAPVAAPTKG